MKYLLLVYSEESSWTEEERAECMATSKDLCHELAGKRQFLDASPLQSVKMATSVRIREGKRLLSDGPFAETREQLGGYYLIDVPDLDEAIRIASRIPSVERGTIEIRPIVELEDMPLVDTHSQTSIGA